MTFHTECPRPSDYQIFPEIVQPKSSHSDLLQIYCTGYCVLSVAVILQKTRRSQLHLFKFVAFLRFQVQIPFIILQIMSNIKPHYLTNLKYNIFLHTRFLIKINMDGQGFNKKIHYSMPNEEYTGTFKPKLNL